jgi:drug/metabolite transporter (DMT)-like permease
MNILLAIFCVLLFSLTVPFTRIVALELAPEFVTLLRLLGGGVACLLLVCVDSWRPPRHIWRPLIITSLCAVVGFAALMAFALHQVPGSHGAIALAALPAVTAAYASLRDRHNPGLIFWLFAIAGTALSGMFFFTSAVTYLSRGDFLLGLAVCTAALGYVEGGRLSRAYGGRRVMSWAIVITLPFTLLGLTVFLLSDRGEDYLSQIKNLSGSATFSLIYLALISQSIGMFLWYRALAKGPMEKVAMTQLLQPFFTLLAAIILLHESVNATAWWIAVLVSVCVVGANRAKVKPATDAKEATLQIAK